jgi:hypothetical protein
MLIPPDEFTHGFAAATGFTLYYHPAQDVLRAGLQDQREPLRQLFKREHASQPPESLIMSTSGRGATPQVQLFGEQFISGVAARAGWPQRPDENAFFDELDPALEQLRTLARKRTVDVPVRVGLAGVRLAPGVEIPTALGTLTAPPAEGLTRPSGWPTADVLVDSDIPVTYRRVRVGEARPALEAQWEAWRTLETRIDKLRLAVLLALWPRGVLRIVTTEIFDPLFTGMSQSRFAPSLGAAELSKSEEREVQTWATRIANHYDQRLAQGIRRALSATDPFREPEDAFVDAVIALEALFGAGKTEVGFRLQLAVAFLVGDSDRERVVIFERVGELYGARSDVVHGGTAGHRAHRLRLDAISLVLRCLRRLLTTRTELIADDARGKTIILATGEMSSHGRP